QQQYPQIKIHILSIDLSEPDAAIGIYNFVKTQGIQINYLVNNAGFGLYGKFHETDWKTEAQMIQLNITALTQLTKLFLPDMIYAGKGRILNVASVAAFVPGPYMAVYYATKAYVLSFSEAIAAELKDTNITVTALCPGPTETGFEAAANLEESKLFRGKKLPNATEVAKYGYRAMQKGKTVAIHGWDNKLLMFSVRFAPRSLVRKAVKWMSEKA
ncbi:MAG: SDR family NAD(P)-dependent oxidoreductase, partial [Bacteroidia bacterium]